MRIDVVTIFPDVIRAFAQAALLGKAVDRGLLEVAVHDLRDHTRDRHRQVDDEPYGGGPGMVMKAEPLFDAVESIDPERSAHVVLLTPAGRRLDQRLVRELAARPRLVLICGRYEGVDERVAEHLVDEELSIGDYVLAGGEAAAIVVVDAVARVLPGVVGEPESIAQESFEDGLLDHPQYTRPARFRDWEVPEVLLSGHHAEIERWRRDEAERRTRERRPDLLGEDPRDPSC
ncbi:MAG TPA: tRNA (guanosine(37)-N1)-methyltransferase TrmD, partial [Actinomycetota bacterium]|nr:tRNA (guanosine(37)-N1)-methyltransferase TrmD [Actinomycetota bacterium]